MVPGAEGSNQTGVMTVVWPGMTIEVGSERPFCRWTVRPASAAGTASSGPGTVTAPQPVNAGPHCA